MEIKYLPNEQACLDGISEKNGVSLHAAILAAPEPMKIYEAARK